MIIDENAVENCEYCRGNDLRSKPCSVRSPGGYGCSQPEGHDGDHVACGVLPESHPIEVWEQSEDEVKTTPEEIDPILGDTLEEEFTIFERPDFLGDEEEEEVG